MDPINANMERLVWLLRQRLIERGKTGKAAGAKAGDRQPPAPTGLETIQALAAVEGVDDRELKRALIQSLLTETLGEELVNSANFQQVVTRVTSTLEADEAGGKLLGRLVGELRASAL